MVKTDFGADFKLQEVPQNFNSTHFLLETNSPLSKIKSIADKYNCEHKFRAKFGGPLYDIWLEEELLIEFISDEIKKLD